MKAALLLATLSLRIFVPAYAYETTTGAVMICDTPKTGRALRSAI